MRILDLFSGIGGFHKGLLQAGAKIDYCGFSEIDKYATSVYKNHFKESEELGNVRTIDVSKLPDIDILCGGFPCQAFSIAGKRKGFEDTRGTLFYEIARICEQVRPSIVFLENVRGLLSHGGGRTFETIIRTMGDLGYCVQWQVCNSRHFGVPQNRERVFIIGHYGKGSFRQIFPIRNSDQKNIRFSEQQAVNCIGATYGKGIDNHGERTMVHSLQTRSADRPSLKYSSGGSGPLSKDDGTVYCLDTGNTQAIEVTAVPLKFLDRNQKNFQGDYSFTVDTCNPGGVMTNSRIRRLTPIECERLQGYPDNWTQYGCNGETISDSQRYKMCGNSVTVNVIEAIARRLI